MAVSISSVSNSLQKVLLPYIQDNFPKATILLDQVKRNSNTTFLNNQFFAPIRSGRHGGVTNLAVDTNNLVNSSSALGQASINGKIITGTFNITDLAVAATRSTKGAVESALSFQAKTLASDFARSVNRQFFSDGLGVVAMVGGSVSSTAITVKAPDSTLDDTRVLDVYGNVNGDISYNPPKYLAADNIIGIGSAQANVGTISSISGSTVNLTGATPSAAGSAITILDGSLGNSGTSEMGGIRAALSSTTGTNTYAGVARNVAVWTPQFGSVSESLSLQRIETSYLKAREFGQVSDKYAIFMNVTLYRKYGDLLTAMRRYVEDTELISGWTGLQFSAGAGKVGVFLDYDVPDGEVTIINFDTWTICQVEDLKWLEDPTTGTGNLFRLVNTIQYQATMTWYANLLCVAPAANGRETQKTA